MTVDRINLETPRAAGYPVVKRTALGQTFNGAVLKAESRDRLKRADNGLMEPIIKPNGKHAQELVVTCLTLPGTTSPAGLGDTENVPEPGSIVRLILKGKAFGDWIEAKRSLPDGAVAVGDIVQQHTATAQAYDAMGNPSGPEITDQTLVDQARSKGRSVGIYGPLTLDIPKTGSEWTTKAVAAYQTLQQPAPVERYPAEQYDDDVPLTPPPPPPGISAEAWASFPPETQAALRAVNKPNNDEPPF